MASIIERFRELNVWRRGSERAPHKPLLVLLALGSLSRGQQQLAFVDCEPKLRELLKEFGPPRKSVHAEYPFWRLQGDGLWRVSAGESLRSRQSNTDPTRTALRDANAKGEFTPEVRRALLASPGRIEEVAHEVLEANFPETLHRDILDAVGLVGADGSAATKRRRDPNFRNAVLVAYQYRCALCGLDLRVGSLTVGLEAAHIKWHQARGPDSVDNSLALCSLHHKLFDFGAFTVSPALRVQVSEHVNGSEAVQDVLLRHHGAQVATPRREEEHPKPEFLHWHLSEVFKQRALP